ncbi:MAG: alpha/beta hydrolase [Actinomycetota bacterium]
MKVNYHRGGSGDALLLIHGIGSQWQVWRPILDLLERERDVIAVDLPGFGESPQLPAALLPTPIALANEIKRLLDDLQITRPAIVGNSLGGAIALALAREGRASSVVAISPSGFWTPREARYCRGVLRSSAAVVKAIDPALPALLGNPLSRTVMLGHLVGKPWQISSDGALGACRNLSSSPGLQSTIACSLSDDTRSTGAAIAVDLTIAWGTRDHLLPGRQALRAQRCIAGSKLIWLQGCGHVPMWDDPELVARVVLDATRRPAIQ